MKLMSIILLALFLCSCGSGGSSGGSVTGPVIIHSDPNLYVSETQFHNQELANTVVEGDDVTFYFTIKNDAGTFEDEAFSIRITLTKENGQLISSQEIMCNDSFTVPFDSNYEFTRSVVFTNVQQDVNVIIEIDWLDQVDEIEESDNTHSTNVDVLMLASG